MPESYLFDSELNSLGSSASYWWCILFAEEIKVKYLVLLVKSTL